MDSFEQQHARNLGEPRVVFVKGHENLREAEDLPVARAVRVVRKVFNRSRGGLDKVAREIQRKITRKVKSGVWMCKIEDEGAKIFLDVKFPTACLTLKRGSMSILLVKCEDNKVIQIDSPGYIELLRELGMESSKLHDAKQLKDLSFESHE